jgi:HKD family nuclease
MFTNHKSYGGDFGKQIINDIKASNTLEIASGYFGVSLLDEFTKDLVDISKRGYCRILIGMIYHEGVSKNQKKILLELDEKLNEINSKSGVFISLRQFHGKVYKFTKSNNEEKIYIGSSNFSDSGFYGNIECNTLVDNESEKKNISSFLSHLFYGNEFTAPLKKVELFIKSKKVKKIKEKLKSFEIKETNFPVIKPISQVDIKLRVDEQPRSSLNLYFEKGRKNKNTGKYSPRPWYEVEITTENKDRGKDYPIGKFTAYAKDSGKFYKLNMITASDNNKAITTKDNREILGELIKGKLERDGHLEKYEKITLDTLRSYGRDFISLKKIKDKEYYLEF